MNNLIQKLVVVSYTDGDLNAEIVEKIAPRLTRTQLKSYIHCLKDAEKRSTVIVESSSDIRTRDVEELHKLFGKKIKARTNPDLLLGLRITDNDDVYNMNLKNSLERITDYVER
jgi:hypothetical protein